MADNKSSMSVVWQACRGWRGATGEEGGQLSECWLKAKCSRSLTSNAVLCGKCKCCKMSVKVSVCAYVCMYVWVRVCVYAHAWTCSSNQSVTLQLFIMQLPVQNDARQHLGTHVKHSLAVQL